MFAQNTPISLNLPTIAPAFNWDFANGTFLNPRIAFSRNSAVASHFNELGLLKADAANVPRFNHALGVSKGLLIEPAATNLLTYSSDFDNAAWEKTNTTISANTIAFLNDEITADTIVENTTASVAHATGHSSFTISANNNYVASFIIKDAGRNKGAIRYVTGTFLTQISADYDLTAKTISSAYQSLGSGSTNLVSGIKELGKGWFLVWVGGKLDNSSTSASVRLALSNGSSTTYNGDGSSGVYIGHAQCELGLVPTSIIQTTTPAVTRALDLLTVSTTNFNFYRQDEYSCYVKFYGQAIGTCTIFDFHDGTANERIYLESINGALTLKIVDGGVEQCSLALGSVVTGTEYRVAVAVKLNDIAASINGAACVTDTSATLPTITAHNLGSNYAGANQMNGTLSLMRGYAARLPNSQLETLTL